MPDDFTDALDLVADPGAPVRVFQIEEVDTARAAHGERLVNWALAVGEAAREVVQKEMSPSRFDVFGAPTSAAIESISLDILGVLSGAIPNPASIRMSDGQREVVLAAARDGVSIEPVTRGLRHLETAWRRAAIELVIPNFQDGVGISLLSAMSDRISAAFATVIDENTRRYHESSSRMLEMRMMDQRRMLDRIISGDVTSPAEAGQVLDLDLSQTHLCVVLSARASHEGAVSPSDFSTFRRACEKALGGYQAAFVPQEGTSAWILVSAPTLSVHAVVSTLTPVAEHTPWLIMSIGVARRDLAGIRAAHTSAQALHMARRSSNVAAPVSTFADEGHLALLSARAELAHLLVEDELDGLLGDDSMSEELRHTLEVLLRNLGNIRRAAEELYVHRNTVAYRLEKMAAAMGRDPLGRPLTTHMALQLAKTHLAATRATLDAS
ncbi:PucR family transcriptional regulator [Salinibacterium sp. GXW1014]|uniref:PucR family transcriptional regulator n=1 Tax=Salinibacterium sp. GXW1014 TaxID=3377838 RepID=UPI00383A91F5